MQIHSRVKKTMGIQQTGTVIEKFFGPFTDGSYRQPYDYENAIYIKWDDNTKGWIHSQFLEILPPEEQQEDTFTYNPEFYM